MSKIEEKQLSQDVHPLAKYILQPKPCNEIEQNSNASNSTTEFTLSLGQTDKKTNPLNILQSGTFHFKLQSAGNGREKKRKGKKFDLTHDESSKPAGNICKSFCFQLFKQCLSSKVIVMH